MQTMTPAEEEAVSALAKLNGIKAANATKDTAYDSKKNVSPVPASAKKPRHKKKVHKYPVEPVLIHTVTKQKGVIDHTYHDFSTVPAEMDYEPNNKSIEDMTFSEKIHHMLSQPANEKIICWMPHGRSFKVVIPVLFERTLCQEYFGHKRYSSFLRQLNNHGFKHITKGPDRNCYYHECMLKNMPHLCKYMPDPKDARRLIADPANEPNFYEISAMRPLTDKVGEIGAPLTAMTMAMAKAAPDAAVCALDSAAPTSVLQARLASGVPWLAAQLPPAKRIATTSPPTDAVAALTSTVPTLGQPQLNSLMNPAATTTSPQTDLLEAALRDNALLELLRRRRHCEQEQVQQQQQQQQQELLASLGGAAAIAQYLRFNGNNSLDAMH